MKKPLISIIVPTYNAEMYIDRLINSITNQISDCVEIIVVNDGSTDNTKKILSKYKNHKQVKIINKNNTGVSSTRNVGLKNATGKYVMFADSDDYYKENTLIKLIDNLDASYDLLVFSSLRECADGNFIDLFSQQNKTINLDLYSGIYGYIFEDYEMRYGNCVWNKVYKLDIIKDNKIEFVENQIIAEDLLFNISYFNNSKKIKTLSDQIYLYCYNANSLTNNYKSRYLDEYIKTLNNLYLILEKECFKDKYYVILKFYFSTYNFIFNNEALSKNMKNSISRLKRYFNDRLLRQALKKVKIDRFDFSNKRKYIIAKYKLYVFIYILYFVKERLKNEKKQL